MEVPSRWYDDTTREIAIHQDSFTKKEAKRYKLDLLQRVARRVAGFSSECGNCQIFQQQITQFVRDLANLSLLSDAARKEYSRSMKRMVKHLQSQHKLVTPGQNIGIWIAIGSVIGVALGAAIETLGAGIPVGVAIGLIIGGYLDSRAKKEGRVI
jgi:uncharacterized protein YcfJ